MPHALQNSEIRSAFLNAIRARVAQGLVMQIAEAVKNGNSHETLEEITELLSRGWFKTLWNCLHTVGVPLEFDSYNREAIAATMGVPSQVIYAAWAIFEGLPANESPAFVVTICEAICAAHARNADLSRVWPQFAIAVLTDPVYGVVRLVVDPTDTTDQSEEQSLRKGDSAHVNRVADLYHRILAGGRVTYWEWKRAKAGASWFEKEVAGAAYYPSDADSASNKVVMKYATYPWLRETLLRLIVESTPNATPLLLIHPDDPDVGRKVPLTQRLFGEVEQEVDLLTLINPDELVSAEDLHDLLVRLGFEEVTVSVGGSCHISDAIDAVRRFEFCHVQFRGQFVLISVLDENELNFDYGYEWPDFPYWSWHDDGTLRGPFTAQTLIERIHSAIQKALDAAQSPEQ